jgi:hypothetical protein
MTTFNLCSQVAPCTKKALRVLKVDIARAFDFVSWPFLIEILEHFGLSARWRSWISAILSSASTKVLLNGIPDERICHGCRLRPMLFLLVMEVLSALIQKADQWSTSIHKFHTVSIILCR